MPIKSPEHVVKETRSTLSDDMRKVLVEGKVTTQEAICDALEKLGHVVNQSKISRLLRKLGAVKSKDEQGRLFNGCLLSQLHRQFRASCQA